MDDDDYLALIELVEQQLRELGNSQIADEANYIEHYADDEGAAPRLMEPKQHLLALLEAFDTQLMLRDGGVAKRALISINEVCVGEGPQSAIVRLPRRPRRSEATISLSEFADLGEVRSQLRELMVELAIAARGEGESGASEPFEQ